MEPKEKKFPWHDFWIYAATTAPIAFTLVFATELIEAHAFALMGIVSVAWFWFVFLANTKFQK